MGRMLRRVWSLLRSRQAAADLDDELAFHREQLKQEQHREGRAGSDADATARRRFGSDALAIDEARDVIVPPFLADFAADVRFALRLLASDKRFTIAAVVALGLGMGVTGSVFALIDAALIRPLPFADAEPLVGLDITTRDGRSLALTRDEYRALDAAVTNVEGIGVTLNGVMNVSDTGRSPERLRGTFVSGNLPDLLRVTPALGRGFLAEDTQPGATPVVLLGHGVWTSRYASDPAVVGRTIRINHVPTTVIGIMPEGFSYPFVSEAWQLLSASPELVRASASGRLLRGAFARLKDGVEPSRAEQELIAAARPLLAGAVERPGAVRIAMTPLKRGYTQGVKAPLLTFLGAVVVVLLVACANVANLLLARAATRAREMAVRASLGASRGRLVRQLLVECLVLAVLGGALGMLIARYGAHTMSVAFSPIEPGAAVGALRPFWLDLSVDGSMLAFAGMVCLVATLFFGLVPALHVARVDVNAVLRDGERGASSRRARRWTSIFVVSEVALTLVLLAATGLMWRSFYALYNRDIGVDPTGLVTMRLTLPAESYDTAEKRRIFMSRLEDTLAGAPGVDAFAFAASLPFTFAVPSRTVAVDGRTVAPGALPPTASYLSVGTSYFDTLRLPLRRGRGFTERRGVAGGTEAVVDERFASVFFPEGHAIGGRIRLERAAPAGVAAPGAPAPWLTIVGVAPTIVTTRPGIEPAPTVYAALGDEPDPATTFSLVVRTDRDASLTVAALRDRVRTLDPDLPLYALETLEAVVAQQRAPHRLVGRWFGVIALITLVLSAVGIWGVTAHGIAQRTREIGIRVALGARSSQIVWLFARSTGALLAIGLLIGGAGALLAGPLLSAFLVGVTGRDPLTLVTVAALLSTVALAAAVIPARRASRVDPVAALRRD